MERKIRVAVVDDHPIVRRGVVETLTENEDFEVVAEGANAEDAVRIAREQHPDLVLLDVTMPGDGVEAARQIAQLQSSARIAMLTIREDQATVRTALKSGAHGYIVKGIEGPELLAAVRKIASGEPYVSPVLAARLLTEDSAASPARSSHAGALASLTERERQIFALLGHGLSNQEIAGHLGLSENTVKHYMTPLLQKLGARNRVEAALMARGHLRQPS
jgi:DNA-binding NarL/FixJ family response regulator